VLGLGVGFRGVLTSLDHATLRVTCDTLFRYYLGQTCNCHFCCYVSLQVTKTRAHIDADTGAILTSITHRSFEVDARQGADRFPKVCVCVCVGGGGVEWEALVFGGGGGQGSVGW